MKYLLIILMLLLFGYSCQGDLNKKSKPLKTNLNSEQQSSSDNDVPFQQDYPMKYSYSKEDSLLFLTLFGNRVLQEKEDLVLQDFIRTENKLFDLLPGIVEKALKTNYDDLEFSEWMSYSDRKSIFAEIEDNSLIDFEIKIWVKKQIRYFSFSDERILEFLETLKVIGSKLLPLNKENGETLFKIAYCKERFNEKYISTVTILKKIEFPTHSIEMTLVSDLSNLSISD